MANRFVGAVAALWLLCSPGGHAAEPARDYLRYLYGAKDVKIEEACWPHPDLWMIEGRPNEAGLAEIAQLEISKEKNQIFWEPIQNGLCIVEVREGKVDARSFLDQIYTQQRQAVLRFIYASLRQDQDELARVATHAAKVRFGRAKPARGGDLDVYQDMLMLTPVIRVSQPTDDQASRSVTYYVPLSPKGLNLKLVKREKGWLVDSDAGIDVPLDVFFAESKERRVIYPSR